MTPEGYPETEEELQKCLETPGFIFRNLHSIKPKKGGVVKFRPNAVQLLLYRAFWWINEILKSRQHGVSTFWMLYFAGRIWIEKDKVAAVIDLKEDAAKKKLGMVKTSYDNLDNPAIHSESWEMVGPNGEKRTIHMWEIGAMIKKSVKVIKGADAPFPQEIVYSNGSSFYAAVSLRGGTLQYGLFTEFGKISHKFPEKAAEVVEGAQNAMHEGSIGVFEFTMEGGESGLAYQKIDQAMKNPRENENLTRLQAKFHFFGWYMDPENSLDETETRMTMARLAESDYVDTRNGRWNWKEYFYGDGAKKVGVIQRLKEGHETDPVLYPVKDLSYPQIAWYVNKRITQGWAMLKEHPTFAEEAFQAPIKGAIYAEGILRAEVEDRVIDFNPSQGRIVHTTWDIGSSKNTVVWYWQKVGRDWDCIDCDSDFEGTWLERALMMKNKGYAYGTHALPHDGSARKIGDISTLSVVKEAFDENDVGGEVKVIPVTSSVTNRIDGMWEMLPNMRFHKTNTEKGRKMLKAYRYLEDTKEEWISDVIASGEANHYADSWGYLWEGEQASYFSERTGIKRGPGVRRATVHAGNI